MPPSKAHSEPLSPQVPPAARQHTLPANVSSTLASEGSPENRTD